MSEYQNPLEDKNHPLHGAYREARETLSSGRPDAALKQWQGLLQRCDSDSVERVEVYRQIPVCQRLMGNLEEAHQLFNYAHTAALRVDERLAALVALDWSVLDLEREAYDAAIDRVEQARMSLRGLRTAQVQAYLGRIHGRKSKDLAQALYHLEAALDGLRGQPDFADQWLDTLFWRLEIFPFWRRIVGWMPVAWASIKQSRWQRLLFDLPITTLGGWRARDIVRRWRFKR